MWEGKQLIFYWNKDRCFRRVVLRKLKYIVNGERQNSVSECIARCCRIFLALGKPLWMTITCRQVQFRECVFIVLVCNYPVFWIFLCSMIIIFTYDFRWHSRHVSIIVTSIVRVTYVWISSKTTGPPLLPFPKCFSQFALYWLTVTLAILSSAA